MLRLFLTYLLLLPFSLMTMAQGVKIIVPEEVDQNSYFELKYVVENADVDDIKLPKLSDFTLLSGPNLSTSSRTIFNGSKMTSTKSITYTYILEPKGKGTFTIPPATMTVDGKKVTTNKATITVTGEGQKQSHATRHHSAQASRTIKNITDKDLFVRAIVSKTKVLEQEAILLTYRVYWRMGVGLSNIHLQNTPDFQGFVTNEIPMNSLEVLMETVNNEPYKVIDRLKYVLFPQQSGALELPSLTVDCEIIENDPSMDAFEAFFNGRMRSKIIKRKSQAVNIEVLPLPLPKPEDFIGVVGDLSMKGKWITSPVAAQTPAHLEVTVSGNGNLKLMLPPTLNSTAAMDVYDVATNENLELTATGHKGKVVYDYTIVPKSAGQLPPLPLTASYYNIAKGRYEQISAEIPTIKVLPSIAASAERNSSASPKDIHTIHAGNHEVTTANKYITWGSTSYIINYILIILAGIAFYFGGKRVIHSNSKNQAEKKALRRALKQLKQAELLIHNKENSKFYELISSTIYNYLLVKFNLQRVELSKQRIMELFDTQNIPQSTTQRLLKVIDECEFAKFAPTADEGSLMETLNETNSILRLIDQ